MPQYTFQCEAGHVVEIFTSLSAFQPQIQCKTFGCTALADIVITAPILVKAAADVCYDSPIDGRPITSWQARKEDLKRNGCRPYDPEMKTDRLNRLKDSEASLDKAVESTVEEAIEKMPGSERGKLYSELTEQGMDAQVVRSTYGA